MAIVNYMVTKGLVKIYSDLMFENFNYTSSNFVFRVQLGSVEIMHCTNIEQTKVNRFGK